MADWQLFAAAAYVDNGKPDHDVMAQFRDAAYAGGIPWQLGPAYFNHQTMRALLRSMARTLTTNRELTKLFQFMDETRQHGWPTATVDGGDILVNRAKGKRGHAPLPDGWEDRARWATGRGKNSSAAFWAGSMLRAAGYSTPDRSRDDPGRGGIG